MYLVFSLLKKESKVIGLKWPILKSSCTGGSICHFHENLTLLADEEITINKIRSHLQKEIQNSFSSVWIALKQTNKQKSMKKGSKGNKIILLNGLFMQMHLFDFVSRPLWLKGKVWNEKEKYKLEREIFPRYIPVWKTYLHKTLCIIK